MQNKFCVIFFERKIQGSASAGSYISLEEVILYLPNFHYKWKYHFALAKYHAEGISLAVRQI